MKQLIRNLFSREGFEPKEFSELTFYAKELEEDIVNYWLIVEVDTLKDVLELQDEWFDTCKKQLSLSDFDKNTSLLILNKRTGNENWKKDVVTIEEDPYQFKKYVLGYDQESLKELKENSQNGNPEVVTKLITSEKIFNEYKANYDDLTWQKLLYTIAQKIPFIELNVGTEKGLDNLFADSKERLKKLDLYDTFKRIDDEFDNGKLDELENLEFEDLYNNILNKD